MGTRYSTWYTLSFMHALISVAMRRYHFASSQLSFSVTALFVLHCSAPFCIALHCGAALALFCITAFARLCCVLFSVVATSLFASKLSLLHCSNLFCVASWKSLSHCIMVFIFGLHDSDLSISHCVTSLFCGSLLSLLLCCLFCFMVCCLQFADAAIEIMNAQPPAFDCGW